MGARIGLGVAFLVSLLLAAPATAATINVTATSDDLTKNDGGCSLREAIATVNGNGNGDCTAADSGGNTIVLGATTYPLTLEHFIFLGGPPQGCFSTPASRSNDNSQDELAVAGSVQNLTIQGAGPSKTVIDACKLGDRALEVKSGATVTLKDLTITNGHAQDGSVGSNTGTNGGTGGGGFPGADGGGILNEGTLTLSDSAVTTSDAGDGGNGGLESGFGGTGGIGGAGGNGGGIFSSGTLTLSDTTISGNNAGNGGAGGNGSHGDNGSGVPNGGSGGSGGNGGGGGGIANEVGSATINGSTITANTSGAGGGGMPGQSPDLVSGGAGGNGGNGGAGGNGAGIASAATTASLHATNDTIEGNTAGNGATGGAGAAEAQGLAPNGTGGNGGNGGFGGGLVNIQSTTQLVNLTISANSVGAGAGGGTAVDQPGMAGSAGHGGGVYATSSTPTVQNTLFDNNEPGGECRGTISDGGHNLLFAPPSIGPHITDACVFTTAIGTDPMLDPLADNGGPTQTMRLQPGSPAIDQVPASGAGCPATDQRGVTRPGGAACDIGAYEVASPAAMTGPASQVGATSATISGTVTANAGDATVRFEFGTDTKYGSNTPDQHLSGATATALSTQLLGLRPGMTYHYRVVASSIDGTSAGGDRTFQTPAFKPSSTVLITGLKVKPKRVHRKRGAKVMYTDLAASTVHFVISRCTRFVKGHCTHYKKVRSFVRHDAPGFQSVRLRTKHLTPGRYRLAAMPSLGGANGATVTVSFRIVS